MINIRFGSYIWEINPSSLEVEYENHSREQRYVGGRAELISSGEKLRRVKGRGIFFGGDKIKSYEKLEEVYLKAKADTLMLPGSMPFKAEFTGLKQFYPEGCDAIGYEFVFTQCSAQEYEAASSVKSRKDESLWDLAYKYNKDINKLIMLNPHVENINYLKENEVVYLC